MEEEEEAFSSEAAAAAYDAWFRRKVQEALDEVAAGEVLTAEEMEAEAETWYAQTRRELAAKARRMAGEIGLDALSEG